VGGRADARPALDPRPLRRRPAARGRPGRRLPAHHRRDGEPRARLREGGAQVDLCAANPFVTQQDVADALGDGVHAGDYRAGLDAVAAAEPDLVLDDGAELIALLHGSLKGATEETRSGLVHLRSLDLGCPVLAVNEANAERALNDRFGTGQSAIDGIVRATHMLLAGQTIVVFGYGWTGRGVALRARGAGASVVVCEIDPLRALEARMEGFDVLPRLRPPSAATCS
jgi:adenosylhomocysteinase